MLEDAFFVETPFNHINFCTVSSAEVRLECFMFKVSHFVQAGYCLVLLNCSCNCLLGSCLYLFDLILFLYKYIYIQFHDMNNDIWNIDKDSGCYLLTSIINTLALKTSTLLSKTQVAGPVNYDYGVLYNNMMSDHLFLNIHNPLTILRLSVYYYILRKALSHVLKHERLFHQTNFAIIFYYTN